MNHGRSFAALLSRQRKKDKEREDQSQPGSQAEVDLWKRLLDVSQTSIREFLEAKGLDGKAIFTISTKEVQADGTNLVPLVLWPNQLRLLELIEDAWAEGHAAKMYLPKDREQGTSFAIQAIFAERFLRGGGGEMRTVSHVEAATKGLCDDFDSILRAVPGWVYRDILGAKWKSRKEGGWKLRMRDGVRCVAQTMTCRDGAMGRGFRLRWVHLSEMPWWSRGQKAVKGALTTLRDTPGNVYVFESTGRGYDDFYMGAKAARDGTSDWTCYFLSALTHPSKRLPFKDDKEREAFEKTVGQIDAYDPKDELRWLGLGATLEQLKWRRVQIAGVCQWDVEFFKQEHPVCLTGDTRVSTERGIIPLREVGTDTETTESGPISRFMRREPEPLVTLRTRDGRVLRGTRDHPIKTPDGFVHLDDLVPGQTIELRPPMFAAEMFMLTLRPVPSVTSTLVIDERWGLFLGMFMGDGSWYKTGISVACSAVDEDVIEEFAALLTETTGSPVRRKEKSRIKGRKGVMNLDCGAKELMPYMEALGAIHRNYSGKGAWKRTVCIPEAIWRSPKFVVREFLRGLFETDGSSGGESARVSYTSCKREMVEGVQLLLLGFGITSRISTQTKPRRDGGGRDYVFHTLSLRRSESIKFMEEIGFVGARKNNAPWRTAKRDPRGSSCDAIEMTDEVVSVEASEAEETFDLTVDDSHVFSANGILTHNCFEDAFRIDSDSAFDTAILDSRRRAAEAEWTKEWKRGTLDVIGTSGDVKMEWVESRTGLWWVKKKPELGHSYCFGADPASGKKIVDQGRREADFATIEVRDLRDGEIVAMYRGHTPPETLAVHVLATAKWYGYAKGYVEANNDGKVVLYVLPQLEELWEVPESCLLTQRKIIPTANGRVWEYHPGFWTDQENKPVLVNRLRRWVREMGRWQEGTPAVVPLPLLDEMRMYVAHQAIDPKTGNSSGRIKYEAASGNDDRVSASYLCMEALEWLQTNPLEQTVVDKVGKKLDEETEMFLEEMAEARRGRGGKAPILGSRFSGRMA